MGGACLLRAAQRRVKRGDYRSVCQKILLTVGSNTEIKNSALSHAPAAVWASSPTCSLSIHPPQLLPPTLSPSPPHLSAPTIYPLPSLSLSLSLSIYLYLFEMNGPRAVISCKKKHETVLFCSSLIIVRLLSLSVPLSICLPSRSHSASKVNTAVTTGSKMTCVCLS